MTLWPVRYSAYSVLNLCNFPFKLSATCRVLDIIESSLLRIRLDYNIHQLYWIYFILHEHFIFSWHLVIWWPFLKIIIVLLYQQCFHLWGRVSICSNTKTSILLFRSGFTEYGPSSLPFLEVMIQSMMMVVFHIILSLWKESRRSGSINA